MSKHGGLSVWHLTMLALGTVVGGSFFLGSAIAIRAAGPGILLSFILGGLIVYIVLTALSEMTVAQPALGSFRTFAEQMYGPAVGFITGWVYWTGLTLAMSSEATAVSVFLQNWIPGLSLPMMATIIIIAVTLVNLVGAKTLTTLESGLVVVKLGAIVGFIVIAAALIMGLFPGRTAVGAGALANQALFPAGVAGIAGSMLIVMFTYAGFEIIGLAASEAHNPHRTVPRAILFTILGLVGLYTVALLVLLPLVPTNRLTAEVSPLVSGLTSVGLGWAAGIFNTVLIIAILSTMLAAMFGMGRMVRSLADAGYAPRWLKESQNVPRRGILFSGGGMLAGIGLAYVLPSQIYIFLVSSGGFALLFVYLIIMATHYKYRRVNGCPPKGNCQLWGYPYTTLGALVAMAAIIVSMPLIPGQGSGLVAGLLLLGLYLMAYALLKQYKNRRIPPDKERGILVPATRKRRMISLDPTVAIEAGEELVPEKNDIILPGEEEKNP